jgi:hypothetical protein
VGVPGERGAVGGDITGGDDARRVKPRGGGLDELERDVRHGEPGRREGFLSQVEAPCLDLDAVRGRVLARHLDGHLVHVDRDHWSEAELRGGDREDAGAAADVEQRASALVEQELERESGRRVRTRPERTAGVDHDDERLGRRLLPRRPDPERADPDRVVELAPAVRPRIVDLAD